MPNSIPPARVPAWIVHGRDAGQSKGRAVFSGQPQGAPLFSETRVPERRAFGKVVFYTVYYAIMSASSPVPGAICDVRARPEDALVFGMIPFATVVPAAFPFRYFKAKSPSFTQQGTP